SVSGGVVTGVAPGRAVVTARSLADPEVGVAPEEGCEVVVLPRIDSVRPSGPRSLRVGSSARMAAAVSSDPMLPEYASVLWSSSDPSVAAVDPATGEVAALSPGRAALTAASAEDPSVSGSADVEVLARIDSVAVSGEPSVKKGQSAALSASVASDPDDGAYKGVTWSSSNTSVAAVSSAGVVTGIGVGTATITAASACDASVRGSRSVEVKANVTGVTVSGASSLTRGFSAQLSAAVASDPDDSAYKGVT
ncbi:MAG TPA: hypothetical protein DCO86_01530, partial [Spirochaetaceae bacterium]|nr:hypothetical protein [Spirochaetaceae bacterium]